MNNNEDEFYQRIKEKYPSLFAVDEQGNLQDPYCGFGCPKGWEPIVESLCASIHWHVTNKPEAKIVIAQVKSKFGSLRFYYDGGDERIAGMVQLAEKLSSKVSEDSGAWGFLQKNKKKYYRTLTAEEGKKQNFS